MAPYFALALLGAESTGKSSLALQLKTCFELAGFSVFLQSELLRLWCEKNQSLPSQQDQHFILAEQIKAQNDWHLNARANFNDDCFIQNLSLTGLVKNQAPCIFISDTAALQTAAYSHYYFADNSLDESALIAHDFFDFSFLMGLDLPWQQDPLRTGSDSQMPVDSRLRQLLSRTNHNALFSTVYGHHQQRLMNAWTALQKHKCLAGLLPDWPDIIELANKNSSNVLLPLQTLLEPSLKIQNRNQDHLENGLRRWGHFCENCADGECEKKLFSQLKRN